MQKLMIGILIGILIRIPIGILIENRSGEDSLYFLDYNLRNKDNMVDTEDIVEVFIEVTKESNIKYEHEHETGKLICDRVLHTTCVYPYNYGYIGDTLAGDGDPLDIMVVTGYGLMPGCYIKCKILGVLFTRDEKGMDEKLIAVPIEKIDPYMRGINKLEDLKEIQRDKIKFFFEHYKKLEPGKWVEVTGWGNKDDALNILKNSRNAYIDKFDKESDVEDGDDECMVEA